MEALLSLSFDNIASKDTAKIRKGLRQIEGMLAHICLDGSKTRPAAPAHRRNQSAVTASEQDAPKKLGELSEDPAFREFFRLQDGFEWNGAHLMWDQTGALLTLCQSLRESQTALNACSAWAAVRVCAQCLRLGFR